MRRLDRGSGPGTSRDRLLSGSIEFEALSSGFEALSSFNHSVACNGSVTDGAGFGLGWAGLSCMAVKVSRTLVILRFYKERDEALLYRRGRH